MRPVLLDTGPVVALLDAADSAHAVVKAKLLGLKRQPLVTSGAVVTEVMFHLQDVPGGPERAADFLIDAAVRVEDVFTLPCLRACAELMDRHLDTPMDFADATLVMLAAQFTTADILTLDERGFRTYRFLRNRTFRLLLQDKR